MTDETKRRLYYIREDGYDTDAKGSGVARDYLIDAISPAQALRAALGERFSVAPASPRDVARLLSAGIEVVKA